MRINRKGLSVIRWCCLLLGIISLLLPAGAQDAAGSGVVLSVPDSSAFPEVSFNVRVYAGGRLLEGLETGFSITEDGGFIASPVAERLPDLPVHLTVFIDDNPYPFVGVAATEIRDILGNLSQLGYRDGDTISVYGTRGKAADYTTWSAFNRWLQGGASVPAGDRAEDDKSSITSLDSALREVGAQKAAGETVSFLYIARVVQEGNGSAASTAAMNGISAVAKQFGITVHVIHANTNNGNTGYEAPLATLASQNGGVYIALNGSSTSAGAISRAGTALSPLFTSRAQYRVRYRSSSGSAAARAVTVSASGQSASTSYTVVLQNPVVSILTPTNGQSLDRGVLANYDVGRNEFSINSADVQFSVEFPDGIIRPLRQVQVVEVSPTTEQSIYTQIPGAGESVFQTAWDLSTITGAGDNPRTLRVVATDELGLTGVSQVQVIVPVPIAPAVPTALPPVVVVLSACEQNLTSQDCVVSRVTLFAPYVAMVILGVMVLLLRRQIARIPVVQGVGQVARNLATAIGTRVGEIRKTILGDSSPDPEPDPTQPPPANPQDAVAFAFIHVSNGPDGKVQGRVVGKRVPLVNKITKLGRDPQVSDIEFYGPTAQSSVSRSHCEIEVDSGRRTATLKNLSESSPLSVNGVRLSHKQSTDLPDNAYVEVGNINRNGLSFDFRYGPKMGNNGGGRGAMTDIGSVPTYLGSDATPAPEPIRMSAELPLLNLPDMNEEAPDAMMRTSKRRVTPPRDNNQSDDWMKDLKK